MTPSGYRRRQPSPGRLATRCATDAEQWQRGDHYFTASPSSGSAPRTVRLDLPDLSPHAGHRPRRVLGRRGRHRVRSCCCSTVPPPPPTGDLLDLGCGYGPLALHHGVALAGGDGVGGGRQRAGPRLCAAQRRGGRPHQRPCRRARRGARRRAVRRRSGRTRPSASGRPRCTSCSSSWLGRLDDVRRPTSSCRSHLGADSLAPLVGEQGCRGATARRRGRPTGSSTSQRDRGDEAARRHRHEAAAPRVAAPDPRAAGPRPRRARDAGQRRCHRAERRRLPGRRRLAGRRHPRPRRRRGVQQHRARHRPLRDRRVDVTDGAAAVAAARADGLPGRRHRARRRCGAAPRAGR